MKDFVCTNAQNYLLNLLINGALKYTHILITEKRILNQSQCQHSCENLEMQQCTDDQAKLDIIHSLCWKLVLYCTKQERADLFRLRTVHLEVHICKYYIKQKCKNTKMCFCGETETYYFYMYFTFWGSARGGLKTHYFYILFVIIL